MRDLMATRLVIVDPQPLFRQSLAAAFDMRSGWEAVGSVADEEEAIRVTDSTAADLVLSEIELDRGSGLRLATRMADMVPVVILTRHQEGDVLLDAASSGAAGCISHGVGFARLHDLIKGASVSSFCVDDGRLRQALRDAARMSADDKLAEIRTLTVREREVLHRLARGGTDEEIAAALYISPHTVRTHVGRILHKLGVHSRADAARIALSSRSNGHASPDVVRIEGPGWPTGS
jgi:DNA-binding NarL/FixJ family response regulator